VDLKFLPVEDSHIIQLFRSDNYHVCAIKDIQAHETCVVNMWKAVAHKSTKNKVLDGTSIPASIASVLQIWKGYVDHGGIKKDFQVPDVVDREWSRKKEIIDLSMEN
jgi:hypothetical protein